MPSIGESSGALRFAGGPSAGFGMSKAGGSVAGGLLVLQRTQMALDFVMAEKKHKNNQLTAV